MTQWKILAALLAGLAIAIVATSIAEAQPTGKTQATIRVYGLASDGVVIPDTPVPTATPAPDPTIVPAPAIRSGGAGEVTHYGIGFQGSQMGCPGSGVYDTNDTTIVAVGPSQYQQWPCGTGFYISGPNGSIWATRQDSCPGCGTNHLDLSEAGMLTVCGYLGRCPVWIEVQR